MWFFEGFCKLLKPKYCVLIDVGTVPSEDGLVNYFKGMEADVIFILDAQNIDNNNQLYTQASRAKQLLYVINVNK